MCKKIVFVFLFSVFALRSADIGSDTAVSRFNTQQTLANGDRVAGFAWLNGGFELTNSATTADWDSFFQVSGDVDWNLGTLSLSRDLIFHNVTSIIELGDIIGNGHEMHLSAKMSQVPTAGAGSGCVDFSDLNILLNCNVHLQDCCIKFSGNSCINGRGYCLTIDDSCSIIVDSASELWFKNITLKNINGNKLDGVDSSSTYAFSRATIVMDGNTTFTEGKFNILDTTKIIGDGFSFEYQTDGVSTVSSCGKLILDVGVTFDYDPSIDSNDLLVLDDMAEICLNSATIHASTAGLQLTKGTLTIDGQSFLTNDGATAADGFQFGDGVSAANNLCIEFLPAGSLELLSGVLTYDNV